MKPDAGPSPALDAPTIQTNFAQFASIFSNTIAGIIQNHTPLNNRNQGDHESVIMQLQTGDPGITQDLDSLYAKNASSNAGTQPQLWLQIPKFLPTIKDPTNNPNLGMQLTYNSVGLAGPQYYSFIGGQQLYLVYFGTDTGTSASSIIDTITLSPAPTKILMAIATPNNFTVGRPGAQIPFTVSTLVTSSNTFQIFSTGNLAGSGPAIPYSFGWIAIAIP